MMVINESKQQQLRYLCGKKAELKDIKETDAFLHITITLLSYQYIKISGIELYQLQFQLFLVENFFRIFLQDLDLNNRISDEIPNFLIPNEGSKNGILQTQMASYHRHDTTNMQFTLK